MRGAILSAATLATTRATGANPTRNGAKTVNLTQQWDKTFPKSKKVEHRKVMFKNRYGITLAGDLYLPADRGSRKLAALAVSGPFGAVKEQSFSAAVDFLGLQSFVDRDRIGVIGICGFGGMGLAAAAVDKRIKALVTTSMYDMSRVMARGYYDKITREQRAQTLERISRQRWTDAANGSPAPGPRILPETLQGISDPVARMYFDYYRTPRGFHPRSPNSSGAWTATGPMSFMNLPLLTYIGEISPRPILLIAGENAHSRYFSEDAYKAAAEPKELVIIRNADHVDLYDRMDKIPFDRITGFFATALQSSAAAETALGTVRSPEGTQ